ncbi:MAG: sulfatase [Planctomycetota bacterium]|jgi:arylsulfatase
MSRVLRLAMAACLAAACAPACAPAGGSSGNSPDGARSDLVLEAGPKHVVLVVIDSLRADHVGAYGYDRPTTPHLDALAEQGVRYERAYAASSARGQALSALWTGRLPSSGGAIGLAEATPHPELLTLPRLFLRTGFRTGLASNDPTLRARSFTRGFDDVEVDSTPGRWTGGLVTEKALDMLDAAGDARVFLTVGYADAGEPHFPLMEYRERIDAPYPEQMLSIPNLRGFARKLPAGIEDSPGFLDLVARYDAEVAYVDACLGALVEGLAERGVLDDTLLIVTSSHGVEFLEHGYVSSAWTLYEEMLRVPLVVRAPGLDAGTVSEPVSLVDIAPSLRDASGLRLGEQTTDGRPFLTAHGRALGRVAPVGAVLAELVIPELTILRAAIRGDAKLIEVVKGAPPQHRANLEAGYDNLIAAMLDGTTPRPDPWGEPVARELYDLGADPAETTDLSATWLDRLESLRAGLSAYADHCREAAPAPRAAARRAEPPDPDAAAALQQLGYL